MQMRREPGAIETRTAVDGVDGIEAADVRNRVGFTQDRERKV